MRLWCWYCHKSVSSELADDTLFRAIAVCPECIEKSPEAANHPLLLTEISTLRKQLEVAKEALKKYSITANWNEYCYYDGEYAENALAEYALSEIERLADDNPADDNPTTITIGDEDKNGGEG
jgi:hypothetical protein